MSHSRWKAGWPLTLVIEGGGLLATAFRRRDRAAVRGLILARGLADSTSTDPAQFRRERQTVADAIVRAGAAGVPIVYFSTASVYGPASDPADETSVPRPSSAYTRHKLACEELIRAAPSPSLIVRLPNVVGHGGNRCQLIPSLTEQVLSGRVSVATGATRDIVAVDDVVGLTIRLLRAGAPDQLASDGRVVNVVSGISTPVELLVTRLAAALGCRPVIDRQVGGDQQVYANARMADLVGPLAFDAGYPDRTIDRYARQVVTGLLQTGGPVIAARAGIRRSRPSTPSGATRRSAARAPG